MDETTFSPSNFASHTRTDWFLLQLAHWQAVVQPIWYVLHLAQLWLARAEGSLLHLGHKWTVISMISPYAVSGAGITSANVHHAGESVHSTLQVEKRNERPSIRVWTRCRQHFRRGLVGSCDLVCWLRRSASDVRRYLACNHEAVRCRDDRPDSAQGSNLWRWCQDHTPL